MKHRTPCKQIFCLFTHSQPLDGVKMSKQFLSEECYVAFKIKTLISVEHYAVKPEMDLSVGEFDLYFVVNILSL